MYEHDELGRFRKETRPVIRAMEVRFGGCHLDVIYTTIIKEFGKRKEREISLVRLQ